MVIYAEDNNTMLDVVSGLVQRGLSFKVVYSDGQWAIHLTGGY